MYRRRRPFPPYEGSGYCLGVALQGLLGFALFVLSVWVAVTILRWLGWL